jgi:release factor glutamine methyltransferase
VRIVTVPGVFRPISDTWMLADALRAQGPTAETTVLDLCTGSGAIAVSAALAGAGDVTAVDVSRRAVLCAWLNGRLNGVRVRAVRGDLLSAVGDRRFDVIVSNPPYVPASTDELPTRGPERAWDAGRDGRLLLDRICADAPAHLTPGGVLLLIHSSVCGTEETIRRLEAGGLEADVLERRRGPLGPLLTARAQELEARGALRPGEREEELVIVRGRASARSGRSPAPSSARDAQRPPSAAATAAARTPAG